MSLINSRPSEKTCMTKRNVISFPPLHNLFLDTLSSWETLYSLETLFLAPVGHGSLQLFQLFFVELLVKGGAFCGSKRLNKNK